MTLPQPTSAIVTLGFTMATLLLSASASMASVIPAQVPQASAKEALTECLDSNPTKLPRLMSTLGAPAVAGGFELLVTPPARPSGNTWLSTEESRAIFEGLGEQPRALRRYLELNVVPEGDLNQRAIGIEALSQVATDSDLDLLLALASSDDPAAASPVLDERLRATVLASLRDGRWTRDVISTKWDELPVGVRRALTDALGATNHLSGVDTLVQLLFLKATADKGLVLDAIEQVAKRHPILGGPNTQTVILKLLESPDPKLRRSAIRAAAALQLEGAVPELVKFAGRSKADRESTIDALRTITDVQLPYDVDRWNQWLRDEQMWRAEQLEQLDVSLAGQSAILIHHSLRELGDHRWGRRDTVTQLKPLLSHQDPNIRAATAACLGRLRCTTSTEDLIALLDDDAPVAAAARAALQAVTGKELPRGSDDWASVVVLPVLLD